MAMSGQLVINCRILRQIQDPEARTSSKLEISRLARELLTEAHANSEHLHTLSHSVALPFAALLLRRFSRQREDIIIRCAVRFAGDPSKPCAGIPSFSRFNAEQMMAIAR